MTARILHRCGIAVGVVLFSFVCIASGSVSATTPIYKCFDRPLGLLYTDESCKEGELLNIRAGDADPAAIDAGHLAFRPPQMMPRFQACDGVAGGR
jgi:hypothetical protein